MDQLRYDCGFMVKPAPDHFNPELVARQCERLSVAFPLSQCKRLVELLADDSGQLEGEFEVEKRGQQLVLTGKFATRFMLECQRCLHHYEFPAASEFEFVLVSDLAAAEALPQEQDALIIGEDGMLHVVDIFEDELILQLPTIPRHDSAEDCTFDVTVDVDADPADNDAGEQSAVRSSPKEQGSAAAGMQRGTEVFAELRNLRFDK